MAKEYFGRTHGDGHLVIDDSFYSPVEDAEVAQYAQQLTHILEGAGISLVVDPQDLQLPTLLLALKQRLMVAFSNGCPRPEEVTIEYLKECRKPTTLAELAVQINQSGYDDGKHNFLFRYLVEHASPALLADLQKFHPWTRLNNQEDHNLPQEMTAPEGNGATGLAYDPLYFDMLVPLYKYIDNNEALGTQQDRYLSVISFLEYVAKNIQSVLQLIEQVNGFLSNPSAYID